MPFNAKNSALVGDVIFSQSQATASADIAQARSSPVRPHHQFIRGDLCILL